MPDSRPLRGILLICSAVLLFATLDSLSKYLSAFHSVVMLVWFRYAVHSALLCVWLLPRRGLRLLHSHRPLLQLLRGLCLLGTSLLFISGLRHLPLGEATAINFIAPLLGPCPSSASAPPAASGWRWAPVLSGC